LETVLDRFFDAVVPMIFAPAVGIACCQVLAAMFGFVAVLLAVLGGKNWIVGEGMAPAQAFLLAAAFVGGGLAFLWFARLIQKMSRGG
jgi:hypothetical protein